MRRVCLAIGVSRAEGLAPLGAAATAAEEIGQWAELSGFSNREDVRVLTDRDPHNPVTIDLIARTILELFPIGVQTEAFLLHFAGHGLREDNTRTLWLPTNWRSELRAIAVERLKNRLSDFGIANVTIISDACKALATDKDTSDLTPDGVLGSGISAGVRPIFDRYDAVHDVESAFMIPGPTPAESRCLFSGAFIEALWGNKQAIDAHYPGMVTPGSLADYLSERIAELCGQYELSCEPQSLPGRPADHLIYFDGSKVTTAMIPALPPWPKPIKLLAAEKQWAEELSGPELTWLRTKVDSEEERSRVTNRKAERRDATTAAFATAAFAMEEPLHISQANLVLSGGAVAAIWSVGRVRNRGNGLWLAHAGGEAGRQLVVEYEDHVFVPLVVYQTLVTIAARDTRGTNGWLFQSPYDDAGRAIEAAQVLARMQAGELPASEVDHVAAQLRLSKHGNPALGAICSYLYDYAGDLDSIRRMAFFYVQSGQPIPYDIALMGELSTVRDKRGYVAEVPKVPARVDAAEGKLPDFVTKATRKARGRVGGLCPWLRKGWDFVETPTVPEVSVVEQLQHLRTHLLPETFTSFDRAGGEFLVTHWGMQRWE